MEFVCGYIRRVTNISHTKEDYPMPTATKTKRQAQSPAKKTTRTARLSAPETAIPLRAHPISAPLTDPNHVMSFFEPADMTRTHELIVDAVTTMLTSGGHGDDVELLIYATMSHTRRRTFDDFTDSEEMKQRLEKFITDDFGDWKHDLVAFWRKNKRVGLPAAIEPKSITDRIRYNVREHLHASFLEFMGMASPEEQRFMLNVLQNYWSRSHPAEHGAAEIFIANAFGVELDRNDCYMRVPKNLAEKVEAYIKALHAVEDRAE